MGTNIAHYYELLKMVIQHALLLRLRNIDVVGYHPVVDCPLHHDRVTQKRIHELEESHMQRIPGEELDFLKGLVAESPSLLQMPPFQAEQRGIDLLHKVPVVLLLPPKASLSHDCSNVHRWMETINLVVVVRTLSLLFWFPSSVNYSLSSP